MKKVLSLILVALLPMLANAYDAKIDGIYYNFSGDKATVTYQRYDYPNYFSDYSGSVVIPESVTYNGKTYSVTSIGVGAFSGCSDLTSITIPNSVTSIGDGTFNDCSGLTSITIPNTVTSIGGYAFQDCSSLQYNEYSNAYYLGNKENPCIILIKSKNTDITICDINASCKFIYYAAFRDCSRLTSITIPNRVTSIGSNAFYGCKGLTSVTIPEGVASIERYTFYNCSGLTSITIPNSVTSIGESAFDGTAWFNNQPNGLVYAGRVAYKYRDKGIMPSETEITIQDGTIGIADGAFSACSGLTSITIPNSVINIGSSAFLGCSGLTSVSIPNSVANIGGSAFKDCNGLTSITISNRVNSISYAIFEDCI